MDLALIKVPMEASSCPAEVNRRISGGWFATLHEAIEAQKEVTLRISYTLS